MLKILHVVGTRPNFIKISPIMLEMGKYPSSFEQYLVHTGQHYDENMSQVFFEQLGLPKPDVNLEIGSGSHTWQTANIMLQFEKVVLEKNPDWVFVVGDVNSTIACTLVCSKLGIKVAHVEAGLRSFDRSMPEEINRILTDQIADLLFTPSSDGDQNLINEGVSAEKIHLVGNVMIDTLVRLSPLAEARWHDLKTRYGLKKYILVTIHRDFNVDVPEVLQEIIGALDELGRDFDVIFPIHPRTRNRISEFWPDLIEVAASNIRFIDPLGYLDFLALQTHAALVLTDSGGLQEETTYLGVPCLTVRPNTERPVTITHGTNRLVSGHKNELLKAVKHVFDTPPSAVPTRPPLWDGQTSVRIVKIMQSRM